MRYYALEYLIETLCYKIDPIFDVKYLSFFEGHTLDFIAPIETIRQSSPIKH